MRTNHPIFQGPLNPGITLEGEPWTEAGDGQKTWIVQTGKEGKENDYGLVSDGHGFEDSPDTERISGGVNSKGPRAVAIGRQANLMQWGFYCAPDRMTDSARKVFLNAIVWMRRFDGQRPLVEKRSEARSWLVQYAETYARLTADQANAKDNASYLDYLRKQFPPGALTGDGPAAWYQANEEYLYREGHGWQVDADLAAARISNRKREFFDFVLGRLQKDASDAVAVKLLQRYAPDAKTEVAALRVWLTEAGDQLFFSDVGGYRWFVAPTDLPQPPK
ncbi:MAG: hypothetical protein IPK26_16445 [Planctomycetes bacterium]|nr:hypothetical protein [Planctomycetota bacterium]